MVKVGSLEGHMKLQERHSNKDLKKPRVKHCGYDGVKGKYGIIKYSGKTHIPNQTMFIITESEFREIEKIPKRKSGKYGIIKYSGLSRIPNQEISHINENEFREIEEIILKRKRNE